MIEHTQGRVQRHAARLHFARAHSCKETLNHHNKNQLPVAHPNRSAKRSAALIVKRMALIAQGTAHS